MSAAPGPVTGRDPAWRSSEDILAAELPMALRGYRMEDVDALLGELALQVAAMQGALDGTRAGDRGSVVGPATAHARDRDLEPAPVDAETAPLDAEPPRETFGVTAGARRRALVPSAALTGVAAVALLLGWVRWDRTATLVAIAVSALALIGVAVAVWRTRERSSGGRLVPGDTPSSAAPAADPETPGSGG